MKIHTLRNLTLSFLYILILVMLLSCQDRNSITENSSMETDLPKNKSLAEKPPMGWNSWDCFGWSVTEEEVIANADYMARHLKDLGYEYVVIDMGWYADSAASDFEAFVHETIPVKPHYALDEYGRLLPDPVKFPSSAGGKGFKPLADYVHSLGLKFGVHLLRGIPWESAEKNLPIKGTTFNTLSISLPLMGCEWYDGFYGVDMTKPGAQEYYNSVFELFAEWGIDFVKVDDMVNIPELEGISKASRNCSRDIVLSVVPGDIPVDILKKNAHMARTGFDFWDVWQMLKVGFPVAASAVKTSEPGYWPDLDMLPIGKIGIKISYKGPDPRISNFNKEELHSLLTLWYIAKMPLFIGGNLPETDSLTYELITDKEALDVNRNSINNRQIKFKNAIIIWTSDIPDSKDKYLAFFNQWESKVPVNISMNFDQIGLDPSFEYKVRDLWEKKDLGIYRSEFSYPVKAHSAGLYRVSTKE